MTRMGFCTYNIHFMEELKIRQLIPLRLKYRILRGRQKKPAHKTEEIVLSFPYEVLCP